MVLGCVRWGGCFLLKSGNGCMINWKCYPINIKISDPLFDIVKVFEKREHQISFSDSRRLASNAVLAVIRVSIQEHEYQVEAGKTQKDKIKVSVIYKERGRFGF